MPPPQSRALLFRLLQGDTPSPAEVAGLVRAFRAQQQLEGQWFDLKAGALLRDKDGKEKLRAAACGFANAEGGFLLIGYDETAKAFDGVARVGKQPPEHWATDSLRPIAHAIRQPHYATVTVAGKRLLLVAIERARSLVYVIEKGEPVYYLRFGHQTLPMAPSHVADLLLGRRAQPDLRVTQVRVSNAELARERTSTRCARVHVSLLVDYENDALVLAEMVRCGLVGPSVREVHALPQQLRRSIDVFEGPPDTFGGYPWGAWGVQHIRSMPAESVEPFAPGQAIVERWLLPLFWRVGLPPQRPGEQRHPDAPAPANGAVEIKAALYLIAKNTEPSWWQLVLRYDEGAEQQLTKHTDRHLRIEPCFYSRPVVSVRFLDEGAPVEFP